MATTRKGEVNKSEAIREFLAANKKAKASTVIEGLAGKGITVGSPLVYAVMRSAGPRRGQKTRRGAKTSRGTNGHAVSLESLLAAKKMVEKVGGVENARRGLDVLAKLA